MINDHTYNSKVITTMAPPPSPAQFLSYAVSILVHDSLRLPVSRSFSRRCIVSLFRNSLVRNAFHDLVATVYAWCV